MYLGCVFGVHQFVLLLLLLLLLVNAFNVRHFCARAGAIAFGIRNRSFPWANGIQNGKCRDVTKQEKKTQ